MYKRQLLVRIDSYVWAVTVRVLPELRVLELSNADFTVGAIPGIVIGAILNRAAGSTLAIEPADSRVAISAGDLVVGVTPSPVGSFSIDITETLVGALGSPRTTPFTISVVPPIPVNPVAPSISGALTIGATLTGDPGVWGNMEDGSYTYAWTADGTPIPAETGVTLEYAEALMGAQIAFRVTATNDAGTTTATSPVVQIDAVTYLSNTVTLDGETVTYPAGGYGT